MSSVLERIRLARLLRSRRPPHAFVLTRNRLVYVGRRPAARGKVSPDEPVPMTVISRPLPEGALPAGPEGIPVPGKPFAGVVASLLKDAGAKISAASLVLPDDFVRVLTVDVDEPEKNPREAEEVILWKLGKVFGEPAPALRISWQTAGAGAAGVRVVAVATPEATAAGLESAFLDAGVRIGALESAALAVSSLAQKVVPEDGFIVWADGDAATTVFFKAGSLRFLRTKATSDPEEALQEIRLAASFVAADQEATETAPLDVSAACAAGPIGSPIVDRFRAFRAEQGGSDPAPISRAALAADVLTLPGVSGASAAPMLAGAEDPALLVALGAMAGGS